jgi:sporulation protein YlmC with PRC-barrel domain
MSKIAVAASILILSSGYCLAQATTPAAPAQTTDNQMTTDNHFVSEIYDQSVYDKNENKIGKVDNLVVGPDGKINSAIVGVGGFLGLGQKDVEIPYSDLKIATRNGKNWLEVDRTKDELQNAPAFNMKTSSNQQSLAIIV